MEEDTNEIKEIENKFPTLVTYGIFGSRVIFKNRPGVELCTTPGKQKNNLGPLTTDE